MFNLDYRLGATIVGIANTTDISAAGGLGRKEEITTAVHLDVEQLDTHKNFDNLFMGLT